VSPWLICGKFCPIEKAFEGATRPAPRPMIDEYPRCCLSSPPLRGPNDDARRQRAARQGKRPDERGKGWRNGDRKWQRALGLECDG